VSSWFVIMLTYSISDAAGHFLHISFIYGYATARVHLGHVSVSARWPLTRGQAAT